MSEQFERKLASWVLDRLDQRRVTPGDRYRVHFPDSPTANAFAKSIFDEADVYTTSQTFEKTTDEVVTFDIGDVPVYLARVYPNGNDVTEPYDMSRWYGSTLRTKLAVDEQLEGALFYIFEEGVRIETLDNTTHDLFVDDGLFPIEDFKDQILSDFSGVGVPGKAFLQVLQDLLVFPDNSSALLRSPEALRQYSTALEACRGEDGSLLAPLLPKCERLMAARAGPYMREDVFVDWFDKDGDVLNLRKQLEQIIEANEDMASRIEGAMGTTQDERQELKAYFEEDFVELLVATSDWPLEYSREDAENALLDGSTDTDSDDSPGGHGTVGKGTSSTDEPSTVTEDTIEIDTYRSYAREEGDIWKDIIASADEKFELTLTFSNGVPTEIIRYSTPSDEDSGSYSVEADKLTISIDGIDPSVPHFYRLDVYIGHKQRSGTPKVRFNIALVPQWFYGALQDDIFQVNYGKEALEVQAAQPITLRPESADEETRELVEDIEGDTTLQLDRPYFLRPKPSGDMERLECPITESGAKAPVEIHFLTGLDSAATERIVFPIMLDAIAHPHQWDVVDLILTDKNIVNTRMGRISTPSREPFDIPDEDHDLIRLEESIIQDESIAPRPVDGASLDTGSVELPDEELEHIDEKVLDAYDRLFDHFKNEGTTPSTSPWSNETCRLARDVITAFESSIDDLETDASKLYFNPYRQLGTLESEVTDKVWLSPFHPLMLAYALQIADWRDELVESNNTSGFRNDRYLDSFKPSGLMPFRWNAERENVLTGQDFGNHRFWAAYSPLEGHGSETPSFMDTETQRKLEAFYKAFPALFEVHPEREISINLIEMGDMEEIIEGLFEFYRFTEQYEHVNPPKMMLRVYGGRTEGQDLEKFFATETSSALTDRLRQSDSDTVDLMHDRISYYHESKYFTEEPKEAHLTFFRGMLDEDIGTVAETDSPGSRVRGLLPREFLRVEPAAGGGTESKSGITLNRNSDFATDRIGNRLNALEASARDASFDPTDSLCKVVASGEKSELDLLWKNSLWVSHIQPNVGLDFYVKASTNGTEGDGGETLMIHYTDQYGGSSGFDVITTTTKRDPYIRALQRELASNPGLSDVNPNTVLTRLVAIDGELALDIQRAEGNTITELLGFVGGLAVSSYFLERDLPEFEWIPLSIRELVRHDRRYYGSGKGMSQYDAGGKATDDLCFVGIPRDPSTDLTLQLWLVETKGGTSSLQTGIEQIQGGVEQWSQIFHPEEGYADTDLHNSDFGSLLVDIGSRLHQYGVIDDDQFSVLESREDSLRDGDFEISFLTDGSGAIGEVVRIQPDIHLPPDPKYDGSVRTVQLPTETLAIINAHASDEDDWSLVPDEVASLDVGFDPERLGDAEEPEPEEEPTEGPETVTSGFEENGPSESDFEYPASVEEEESDEIDAEEVEAKEPDRAAESESTEETEAAAKESETEPPEEEPEAPADEGFESTPADTADDVPAHGFNKAILEQLSRSSEPETEINAAKLTKSIASQFDSLGVDVHQPSPADVSIGPRKVGVNVHPKEGQKIGSILNSLDSLSVHIQAAGTITGVPVPAERAVRLEIPHGDMYDVRLASAFDAIGDKLREPLNIPLGVTTEMEHIMIDLLDEHHLLIGGATGSGKSNFLSTIISSLAIAHSPETVQISILDPKGLDFEKFETLAHVVTYIDDPEEAANYLTGLLDSEVKERQATLKSVGASSVREYNEFVEGTDRDPLPYRVIAIDEYADLSMALGDQSVLEDAVTRLAQIGRALGYSILLATQRPDAEIVSGKIKTNFNSRVAFKLPTGTDSRVILDKNGAEDLQGDGDMIAITQDGTEHHLQAYYLPLEDALKIKEKLSAEN